MITFNKPGDSGILFTALSNYAAALENCIRISKEAGPSFNKLAIEYEQTKKRVIEMLEEI